MDDLNNGTQTPASGTEPQPTGTQNPAAPLTSTTPPTAPTAPAAGVADPMADAAKQPVDGIADPMADAAKQQADGTKDPQTTSKAPEKYEAFKLGDQTLPEETTKAFADIARKHGLSQDEAQEFLNAYMPTVQTQVNMYKQQWLDACMADKELGGEHFKENMAVAGIGYRTYADKDLQAVMQASGLSRHPAVVRHFYRLGKELQQDKGVAGGASAPAPVQRFYPNSNMVPDIGKGV